MVNNCKLGEKKNVNVPGRQAPRLQCFAKPLLGAAGVKVDIPVVGEREIKALTFCRFCDICRGPICRTSKSGRSPTMRTTSPSASFRYMAQTTSDHREFRTS